MRCGRASMCPKGLRHCGQAPVLRAGGMAGRKTPQGHWGRRHRRERVDRGHCALMGWVIVGGRRSCSQAGWQAESAAVPWGGHEGDGCVNPERKSTSRSGAADDRDW